MPLLLSISSKFSGRPSPKIRASPGKNYIFEILTERAISENSTLFQPIFCDEAHNRTMDTNKRLMRVSKTQLFGYSNYIIDYKCANFHCSSFFDF